MSTRKLHVGLFVRFFEGDLAAPMRYLDRRADWPGTGGRREHPAVISAVDDDDAVDLTVFLDHGPPVRVENAQKLPKEGTLAVSLYSGWRWPPPKHHKEAV